MEKREAASTRPKVVAVQRYRLDSERTPSLEDWLI